MCIYRERQRDRPFFKEICSYDYGGWQIQNLQNWLSGERLRKELMLQLEFKGHHASRIPSPFLVGQSFFLRFSTEKMKPIHSLEGDLLHSKSTN